MKKYEEYSWKDIPGMAEQSSDGKGWTVYPLIGCGVMAALCFVLRLDVAAAIFFCGAAIAWFIGK